MILQTKNCKITGGFNMKKYLAVLLAVLIIGTTPAFAAQYGINQTTDPMAVKGKGVDVGAADELISGNNSENSTSVNEMFNTYNGTLYTDEELSNINITEDNNINTIINGIEDSTTSEIPNQENSTEITNEPVTSQDNDTENLKPDAENETITAPVLNTTGIVMQTSNYTCGPAALATVLNNMGINATEHELAVLAGTDETGTTMYGLIQAAKSKGLNAKGMKVSINDLKKNSIVFLTINGNTHYSIIREITNESIKLADPGLGNIAMILEEFNNAYSGYALVISDPNISGANETTNTEINSTDNTLTDGGL